MLDSLTSLAEDAVVEAGYAGLLAIMVLETVFPPVPSEIVLPLAGFQVAAGQLAFAPALAASTAGAVAGATLLYALARFGGRAAVMKASPVLRVTEDDLDRADRWFDRRAFMLVLLGRCVPGIRSLVSIPAGLSEMPLPAFLLATTVGSLLWNSALLGAGVAFGANYERVETVVGPVGTAVVVLVALALVAGIVWLRRRAVRG